VERYRTTQNQALGTGDRTNSPIIETPDPGDRRSIVEPRNVLSAKVHPSRPTNYNPHKVGRTCWSHEIDNCGSARLGLKFGFENEGAGAVPPLDGQRSKGWSDEPAPIV
jgi:hypothetical protein